MAGISVSASIEELKYIRDHAISPTKAFRLGVEVIKQGGIDVIKGVKELKNTIEIKQIKIEELEKKIANLKDELEFVRKGYVKEDKNGKMPQKPNEKVGKDS